MAKSQLFEDGHFTTSIRMTNREGDALRAYARDNAWSLTQAVREAVKVALKIHEKKKAALSHLEVA
jgi:hypothetical protein